jgi:hypothetical protein
MTDDNVVGGLVLGACLVAYGLFGWPGLISVGMASIIGVWAWYRAKL